MRALKLLTIVFGVLMTALGIVGMAAPSLLVEFGRSLQTAAALYAIAAARIFFGAVLFFVAPASRMPGTLRVIGAVIVVAGLVTPLFGVERMQAIVVWLSGQNPSLMRATLSVAVVFGLFIIYAVIAPRRPAR
jgi:hypothetical protein